MRIKALGESIRLVLEQATDIRFYRNSAPPSAKPPYGERSVKLLRRQENWDLYDLLVNISDYGQDDTRVEMLADTAVDTLHNLDYFGNDGTRWSAAVNICHPIESEDKNIHQMRISAIIKYYRKD